MYVSHVHRECRLVEYGVPSNDKLEMDCTSVGPLSSEEDEKLVRRDLLLFSLWALDQRDSLGMGKPDPRCI